MVNARRDFLCLAKNFLHAGSLFQNLAHRFFQRLIIDINVRDLMIRHGKNLARTRVENFQTKLFFHRQPALLAEDPVQMNRSIHVGNAVFRKQNHFHTALGERINQAADNGVNLAQVAVNGRV